MNEEVRMLRMSKVFHVCLIVLFISTLFVIPGGVFADEITDSIDEGMQYYKEGDYVEAVNWKLFYPNHWLDGRRKMSNHRHPVGEFLAV